MKSRSFAEKEKTIVHRLTHKAYQFCNSKQIWGKVGPTNSQQKLAPYRVKKNWNRRKKKCRNWGCRTFGKFNLVGQISAVAAFKQFQLVVTFWVIVAGLQCVGTNSKYQHYTKSAKKRKTFRKHGFKGETVWSSRPKKDQRKDSRPCTKNSWTEGFWKQQNIISPANSTT